MQHAQKPLLGFAAISGTGKTTLLTQLIPLLKQQGLKVGVIKHSHHNFAIDQPGKDSYKLRMSGANPMMLASSHRRAIITEFDIIQELTLDSQLQQFEQKDVDLILIEGFKAEKFPKIELYRADLTQPLLYPNDASIIAVASDLKLELPANLVGLDLNNPVQIAKFILEHVLPAQLKTPEDECILADTGLCSLAQAQAQIHQALQPLTLSEIQPLATALGRVVATDLYSPISLPTQNNSAMDGYAFIGADLQLNQAVNLECVGTSWAGKPYAGVLKQGECVRIFTGAVLPELADSVIIQESVTVIANKIHLPATSKAFEYVRVKGTDVFQGELLLKQGKKLTAIDIGLLAAVGLYNLAVIRKLKLAFFSTGDELIALGQKLSVGQIYDSNRYMLQALLAEPSFAVTNKGVVADDPEQLESVLTTTAQDYDVIITTGGASVGAADHLQAVLKRCGTVNFWKVAIKPGKPLIFGKIGNCIIFALPGNPVSVLVTLQKLVLPALHVLTGADVVKTLQLRALAANKLHKVKGRQEYQRGILTQLPTGEFRVQSAGKQGSNILSASSKANCYIVLPPNCTGINVGETVLVEPFSTQI